MRVAGKRLWLMVCLSLYLVGCSVEKDPVEPINTVQDSDLVGYDPEGCNLIQGFGTGDLPRKVSLVVEDRAIMSVKAQRRGHNGKYLPEEDALLLKPGPDMIDEFDKHILGIAGLLTIPDASGLAVHQKGGRLILDFSQVSSVTMMNMLLVDVGASGAKVELFNRVGQLLNKQELITEDKAARFVGFNNIPGVVKVVVSFGDERSLAGSGAIARLQMCIEGEGRCLGGGCYGEVGSMWFQYTGDKPINVKVSAKNGATSKVLLNGHGMKPGTMFKVENVDGLGQAITIKTNRKENHTLTLECETSLVIKKQYGMFKVLDARGVGGYRICLSD